MKIGTKNKEYGRAGLKQFRVVAETDRNYPMGLYD